LNSTTILLWLVIALSIVYTYTNGFQDGSSVAASAIMCRALSRFQAVALVTVFEFLGALLGGSAVANTIGAITSWPAKPSLLPILAIGLFSAISWNFATRLMKVPSSSTHALVGGIVGAVVAGSHGFRYIVWGTPDHIMHANGVWKVILSLFLSPLIGFVAGYFTIVIAIFLLLKATTRVNEPLKKWQWVTVAALAFGHGANDTQKAMGVIVLGLNAAGVMQTSEIPLWVRLVVGTAMGCGIISMVPGIVKRVGNIYRLRPIHGLVTEFASAIVVCAGSATGGPVSASQVIASTVMGVGTAQRRKGVHWLIARDMLMAWFLTIPCAGLLAWLIYLILSVTTPIDAIK
jgi:PiT family inorganic phosphate transporter